MFSGYPAARGSCFSVLSFIYRSPFLLALRGVYTASAWGSAVHFSWRVRTVIAVDLFFPFSVFRRCAALRATRAPGSATFRNICPFGVGRVPLPATTSLFCVALRASVVYSVFWSLSVVLSALPLSLPRSSFVHLPFPYAVGAAPLRRSVLASRVARCSSCGPRSFFGRVVFPGCFPVSIALGCVIFWFSFDWIQNHHHHHRRSPPSLRAVPLLLPASPAARRADRVSFSVGLFSPALFPHL